jgi:hypothetical protein
LASVAASTAQSRTISDLDVPKARKQKVLAKRILRRILRERCRVLRFAFALSRFELVREFYSLRRFCSLFVSVFRRTFMNGFIPAQIAPLMNVSSRFWCLEIASRQLAVTSLSGNPS